MKLSIKKMLILAAPSLFVYFSAPAATMAESLITSNDTMHATAHLGGVYVISQLSQTACRKMLGEDYKISCTVAGAVLGNGVNVAYKARQDFPSDTPRALGAGGIGSLLATGVSLSF